MTVQDWHTHFPGAVDTATELPDVASGDPTRISQLNTIADVLMALETRALTPIIVTSARLAANQTVSDSNNPPTVAMPNLGTLSLTTVVGEVIVLIANGFFIADGAATSALVGRFSVDGTPIDATAQLSATSPSGWGEPANCVEFFTATATSHTVSFLAGRVPSNVTVGAGFQIHAIQFR